MIRRTLTLLFLLIAAPLPAQEKPDQSAEKAVRKNVFLYVRAFNRADASGIAQYFSENGEWLSPDGTRVVGRQAIHEAMEAYFSDGPRAHIVIDPARLKFRSVSSDVIVEEGHAHVTRSGEPPSDSTYIAIHVRQDDGQWKINSVRETAVPAAPSNYQYLSQLEWMIGTWVDRDESGSIETVCQWTKNQNFITRSFSVKIEDRVEMSGTQVIGWDATNNQIRSWLFDSQGGFGSATWSRKGDQWIIRSQQNLIDGAKASSINVISYVNDNTFEWQSSGREVDGQLQPNIDKVTVKRKR